MVKYSVGQRGMRYRRDVAQIVLISRIQGFGDAKLRVEVRAFPPDRRRRDIDNLAKSLLDSLQHAGVYDDDNQIHQLYIEKMSPVRPGGVEVKIQRLP
jgi:Holliday junction resolvase